MFFLDFSPQKFKTRMYLCVFLIEISFSDLQIPESSSKTNVLNLQEDLLLTGGAENAHVDPQRRETIQMLRARLQQGMP